MPPSTIYDYKLFDVVLVQELFKYRPQLRPNAYVNRPWNNEQDAIRQALLDGYRWVRTEGPSAVLEKQLPTPDITTLIPRHIAACAEKELCQRIQPPSHRPPTTNNQHSHCS